MALVSCKTYYFFLFVVILNTIHKQFSFINYSLKQSNLKTAERLKNIRIIKFDHDIFSIPFTLTSFETRKENKFLKSKFELHDKKLFRGLDNLFDLNDFLNHGSSSCWSFLIRVYF